MTNTINCESATAPINIVKSKIMGPCSLLCDYNHTYGSYTPNATNKGSYLSLNYSGKADPVTFNNKKYDVQEIRIYQPSLHKYNNKNAAAEMLIIHGGSGANLIVSVPIIEGTNTDKGSEELSLILTEANSRTPNESESVTLSLGALMLGDLVPSRKGFYSYSGTLLYTPCSGSYDYIVYGLESALHVKSSILTNFKKIIDKTECTLHTTPFFYNKDGANSNGRDDDIYIDCQPANDIGGTQEMTSSTTNSSSSSSNNEINMDDFGPIIMIIVGICVASGIAYGVKQMFKKFRTQE